MKQLRYFFPHPSRPRSRPHLSITSDGSHDADRGSHYFRRGHIHLTIERGV